MPGGFYWAFSLSYVDFDLVKDMFFGNQKLDAIQDKQNYDAQSLTVTYTMPFFDKRLISATGILLMVAFFLYLWCLRSPWESFLYLACPTQRYQACHRAGLTLANLPYRFSFEIDHAFDFLLMQKRHLWRVFWEELPLFLNFWDFLDLVLRLACFRIFIWQRWMKITKPKQLKQELHKNGDVNPIKCQTIFSCPKWVPPGSNVEECHRSTNAISIWR